ncbi:3-hydroxyacyl-CoA dehydrogenase family protein [Microbacterium esteraromaticum]|uniref:3-hydroxyacyl-CoA dehydrogenase family protein n=1 Tax=Microbacterium esteraromaticum TaxID=57043 RepID=A0A7D7WGF6_9MICO|nr:3-hydroxyacyl-CoA dehydrogenase family protein [Microbacterium esteraromaticum]QMU97551.1 3-hydroxyacyl-CoA dehydrogenase family protein [Microbacterium esteraromaticum]
MSVPGTVGVLGGGRMGAGIAHAFLLAGARVRLVERDESAADAARERVLTSIENSVKRGDLTEPEHVIDALRVSADPSAFETAGLVIEAVPEDRAMKAEALARIEQIVAADAVLATNTSSISIDELAAALTRPERFLGLHFFNPVPASKLVELVVGERTERAVVDAGREWIATLRKTPVVVRDSPGFASSRLGVLLGLEAIRMLEEGVGDAADIDAAMELGYRHPMGPLRTTDVVGLDVRLGIAEELARELGPRFEPPALLRRMVDAGKLGRKSGEGFYMWNEER